MIKNLIQKLAQCIPDEHVKYIQHFINDEIRNNKNDPLQLHLRSTNKLYVHEDEYNYRLKEIFDKAFKRVLATVITHIRFEISYHVADKCPVMFSDGMYTPQITIEYKITNQEDGHQVSIVVKEQAIFSFNKNSTFIHI